MSKNNMNRICRIDSFLFPKYAEHVGHRPIPDIFALPKMGAQQFFGCIIHGCCILF